MQSWYNPNDKTDAIITAEGHINSSHGKNIKETLPPICVMFEIGISINYIESKYKTKIIVDKLPGFLESPKCIMVENLNNVCFVRGGYGSPAAVDTLETIIALGVKKVILVGMCGIFDDEINVGDVIVPKEVLREEGTSHHYMEYGLLAEPDLDMFKSINQFMKCKFVVHNKNTVSTDAVYRQTIEKERSWRDHGFVGVDMEASAILTVSSYYKIPAVAILLASDKHPVDVKDKKWEWGSHGFNEKRLEFIDMIINYVADLEKQMKIR